jgi:glycosyltransferase involved in cell wall biosynthesis
MLTYSFYESDSRVQQYAKALAGRGDAVDVIALKRAGQPSHTITNGVNVYRIQSRRRTEKGQISYALKILLFLLRSAVFLTRKHLKQPYHLIHVHNVPDFLVLAATVPKLTGAIVILDIHDILPEFYASKFKTSRGSRTFKFLLLCEKLSSAFSDHVIIANHIWYERLTSRSVRLEKCTPIRNYPDPHVFFPRPRTRIDEPFTVMYPGTLNWHQGLDVAIKAFARVAKQIAGAQFYIYGEGPAKDSLVALTKELDLDGKVSFRNFVPTEEIATIMAGADVAVVPKRASLFGNEAASTKIQEFMALGVPVIASRTKITCYYQDDSRVKFFEPENDAELADCMLQLNADVVLRNHLVSNAANYIKGNNWNVKKQEYLGLVDSLIAAHADKGEATAKGQIRSPGQESIGAAESEKSLPHV